MTTKSLRWSDGAGSDLKEAYDFYKEAAGQSVASEFRESVETSVALIKLFPQIAAMGSHGFHQKQVARFPYAIIYRITSEIEILAVAHSSREPGYWSNRETLTE
jgi:plasmid stabilization system protein ParE